ncbi:MAG: DUF559 domain-containing protein [Chloroflexaceae bacterium]|nr:DUF559 domain-containing protein [Chloroflexaceae bacterium]
MVHREPSNHIPTSYFLFPTSYFLSPTSYTGAQGLAADVRYYGQWMRDEAERRIGHLYPKVQVIRNSDGSYRHATPEELQNPKSKIQNLTVIAWLWARTVKSPNPAFAHVEVPLASTFMLSTRAGKEAWVEPVIEGDGYRFTVKTRAGHGPPPPEAKDGTKLARGANFRCLMSGMPITGDYIKAEGQAGRMGARLMAIVAEGERGRVYLPPTPEHEAIARSARPEWKPETPLPDDPRNFWTVQYGLTTFGDLFTPRQLVALNTFAELVAEARERVWRDALAGAAGASGASAPLPAPPPCGGRGAGDAAGWGAAGASGPLAPHPTPPPSGGRAPHPTPPPSGGRAVGTGWRPIPVPPALLQAARELRKTMTDAEQLLWQSLRCKQLDGFRFRKQHPIERYVLDFYCPSARLAIEIDGGQHYTPEGLARDAERTAWLHALGIRILRFTNHDVLSNLESVLSTIWETLHSPLADAQAPAGPASTTSPLRGEESGGAEAGEAPPASPTSLPPAGGGPGRGATDTPGAPAPQATLPPQGGGAGRGASHTIDDDPPSPPAAAAPGPMPMPSLCIWRLPRAKPAIEIRAYVFGNSEWIELWRLLGARHYRWCGTMQRRIR